MKWAIMNEDRTLASPKSKGKCPICDEKVISKCGNIKVWHWSHKNLKDCDDWYEPESQWHLNWKNEFPKEQQEFIMGKHRADIRTSDRTIIELQNSTISSQDIQEREHYYKRMIWLLNGDTLAKGLRLRVKKRKVLCDPIEEGSFKQCDILGRLDGYYKYTGEQIITFRWKHPPKSWWFAKKNIYIDLGVKLFLIKKIYNNIPCGGWGIILSKKEFLTKYNKGGKDGESTRRI